MDRYHYELASILIPLLAVLIAGGLAFWQLDYRNKQEQKNKWKDDFRLHVAEYLDSTLIHEFEIIKIMKLINKEEFVDELKRSVDQFKINLIHISAKWIKIKMMLDLKDNDNQQLIELEDKYKNNLKHLIKNNFTKSDDWILPKEFSETAKRIYDNK